jgi:hypothetical protein
MIVLMLGLMACARQDVVEQPVAEVSPASNSVSDASPATSTTATASSPDTAAIDRSGTFVSGEHETQGTVRVFTENGRRYLELDSTFQTSTLGPDLFVILHRSDDVLASTNPPAFPLQEQDYVLIDRLQQYSGEQRYQIPDDINLADYESAVIWCRRFNATFGAARLSG